MTVIPFPPVILHRAMTGPEGTFGVLIVEGKPLCVTCEDPWNDNKKGESCVPTGLYECVRHNGTRYRNVWEVTHVPGRSAILIHSGNTIRDTRGCILVGYGFGRIDKLPAVTESISALQTLRSRLPETFMLKIE